MSDLANLGAEAKIKYLDGSLLSKFQGRMFFAQLPASRF